MRDYKKIKEEESFWSGCDLFDLLMSLGVGVSLLFLMYTCFWAICILAEVLK